MTVRFDPSRLHAGRVTLSVYPGHGILFENLPTTGENGGSPLLNDGGVSGDEVRWELLTASGVTLTEFDEDGSFVSDGIGSFVYRSYRNGAVVGDYPVIVRDITAALQNYSTSASGVSICAGANFTTTINAQRQTKAAAGNQLTAGAAVTSLVNVATNIQHQSTSASGNTVVAGAAVTAVLNAQPLIQHLTTAASGNVQQAGAAQASAYNVAVVTQHFSSSASGNTLCQGRAITSFYDDGYVPPFSKAGLSATVRRAGYSATLIQ